MNLDSVGKPGLLAAPFSSVGEQFAKANLDIADGKST